MSIHVSRNYTACPHRDRWIYNFIYIYIYIRVYIYIYIYIYIYTEREKRERERGEGEKKSERVGRRDRVRGRKGKIEKRDF